ncbi:hypothetical protein [Thermomonospora umbrina]|uniref:Uncharacterized protein n=1 Tax=Thermomonospora umbrina TaxID=111806 RepID=A0A3D9STX9_9ACTN|nr:hypothetical protein [Thermomonospora umbrina]REE95151.1 hypothetical protein DFJ69_0533 [Thermomonospora umbrina]
MAEFSYPFDSGTGASITQEDWERMARLFTRSGIPGDHHPGNATLRVVSGGGSRQVTVRTGEAIIRGFVYHSNAEITLTLDTVAAGTHRMDLVVLRLDRGTDSIRVHVIKGTPYAATATPTPPSPQTSPFYDVPLGLVTVKDDGIIPASQIRDDRWMAGIEISTGSSWNKPGTMGHRYHGQIHFENDLRRWIGWDGVKWGIVAETGAWRTYEPQMQWYDPANASVVTVDNQWETHGRYRFSADNVVTFSIHAKIEYDYYPDNGSGAFPSPLRSLRLTLPVPSGGFAGMHNAIAPLMWTCGLHPRDRRTGFLQIGPGSGFGRPLVQVEAGFADGLPHGGLEGMTNQNTPWPAGTHFYISGSYECSQG